jgi:hypothetical protein
MASRWLKPSPRGGRWAMQNGAWSGRSSVQAAAAAAQAWPISFAVTDDFTGAGSSTMNGLNATTRSPLYVVANEDATGADYYNDSGSTPASGPPPVIVNLGAGGTTSAQIETAVTGATAREKASNFIVQLGGNYEAVNNPIPGIVTNAADIATALAHTDFLHVPKHNDGATASGHIDWERLRDLTYQLQVAYPGQVDDAALMFRTHSTGDGGDTTAQALDQIPPSLDEDTAHPNLAGNRILAEKSYGRWMYCKLNAFPFVPYQRRRSTETTNQTNGGLVCTIYHDTTIAGALTDASFSVVGNSDFSVAVETGAITLRRASATFLGDGYYNLTIRATKAGLYMESVVQVFLQTLAPAGAYRTNLNSMSLAREGTVDGIGTVTKLSLVIGVKPLAGWDATSAVSKQIMWFANNKVDIATKASSNMNLGVVFRNAAGTIIYNLDGTTAQGIKEGRGLNGIQWFFCSVDWDNAVYHQAMNNGATQSTGYTMPGAGTESCALFHVGSGLLNYLFGAGGGTAGTSWANLRPCNNMEVAAVAIWPNAYIDFSATTGDWRDKVRDPVTGASILGTTRGADGPGQLNGNNPCLWMEGPAGNFAGGLNLAATSEPWFAMDRSLMASVAS